MKQYDLYANTDPASRNTYPYFVDVQTGLLEELNSRVVIPISPALDANSFPKNLCPIIEINNQPFALLTHQITTVSLSFLKSKEGSLLLNRDDIISALDFLFTGI
ncbi:CcdB family protein [Bowmanella denitrificans]|uniref:CcdB family protein n=1 Tax=Bowmanella denitrificans TaxID=366582 RepID=UPI000C9CFEA4|nr:CcdB family protein [Bowmanella denitrificans]